MEDKKKTLYLYEALELRSEYIELKRRKLNSAIQRANFNHCIDFNGEAVNLSEALETRKALNEQIGEFHNQVVSSSCQKVIYKEQKTIQQA